MSSFIKNGIEFILYIYHGCKRCKDRGYRMNLKKDPEDDRMTSLTPRRSCRKTSKSFIPAESSKVRRATLE